MACFLSQRGWDCREDPMPPPSRQRRMTHRSGHRCDTSGMQTRSVAFLAFDGAMLLDITGPAQVFATANYLSEGRTNPYRTSIT